MARYLVRRLLLTVPVLLGVATLVFALIHLVPGDPAQSMLGESASPAEIARLQQTLGLDRPLLTQYRRYLAGVVRGDLGKSFRFTGSNGTSGADQFALAGAPSNVRRFGLSIRDC